MTRWEGIVLTLDGDRLASRPRKNQLWSCPQKKERPPTLKPTDKIHRPIYMTAAMVMTVLLAASGLYSCAQEHVRKRSHPG